MRVLSSSVLMLGFASVVSAQTGSVFVRSSPPGAQIYVDGEKTSSGTTPTEIRDLSPGKHELRIVFPTGTETVKEVTIQANRQASVSASWQKARRPTRPEPSGAGGAASAALNIRSKPAGAEASVEGKTVGKTPCTARNLAPGGHSVALRKGGFKPYETKVELNPGETRLLQAELTPLPGAAGPKKAAPEIPRRIEKPCPVCGGEGHIEEMGCPDCKHVGYSHKTLDPCTRCGRRGTVQTKCRGCRGAGLIGAKSCPLCGGSGKPRCPLCKGKGKIPAENPAYYRDKYDIVTCPYCNGSVLDKRVVRCKFCSGKGRINMRKAQPRFGTSTVFFVTRQITCWFCDGKGEERPPCTGCSGKGFGGGGSQLSFGLAATSQKSPPPCAGCGGTGKLFGFCQACKGRGWIKKRKKR